MSGLPMRGLALIVIMTLCSLAQGQEYAKWMELAKEAQSLEDHQGAVRYYMEAYALDSSRAELQYALATAHENNHQYRDALRFYQKVYRKDRGRYYPEGPYHIALMYTYLGKYEAAIEYWKRAKAQAKEDEGKQARIDEYMRSAEFALLHPEVDETIRIEQLGPRVNGPESDFAAFMLPDSNLLFSSLRGPYTNDLALKQADDYLIRTYQSEWINGNWKKTLLLDSASFKPDRHYANPVLDPSESWLYISECEDLRHCVIGRFPWVNGIAGSLEYLNGDFLSSDSTHTHAFPFQWEGQGRLLFASDREGTRGGMDLWIAHEENGEWRIKNMGPYVNSAGNEVSPSFSEEDDMLYFSSDLFPGYGGFDVFQVAGPEVRESPKNMGLPTNSSLNDLYFRWQGDWGFLSSNRSSAYSIDGSQCCNDLFLVNRKEEKLLAEVKKDSLEGQTVPVVPESIESVSDLKDLLPISLYFHNDIPDPGSRAVSTDKDFANTLRDYVQMREDYLKEYSAGLNEEQALDAQKQMNIFFDVQLEGQLKVLDEVFDLLLGELEKGKRIEIVIKGYASPLAESDYNKRLTERRIASVMNYFERKDEGIMLSYLNDSEGEPYLVINSIPYGEEESEALVSDNPQDRKNSVYSLAAARERRVEILRIDER